jgi:hypothetical protein
MPQRLCVQVSPVAMQIRPLIVLLAMIAVCLAKVVRGDPAR